MEALNERVQSSESTKAAKIVSLEGDVASAKKDVETKSAKITELETVLAATVAAAAAAESEPLYEAPQDFEPLYIAPPAAESAYYKNCTAARNAGAAPVYRGEPGYGSHLDRDGDGVGCE